MSDNGRNIGDEKTVVVKKGDIEAQLRKADEEKTVVDDLNARRETLFDPELEEILRETEGYEVPDDAELEAESEAAAEPDPETARDIIERTQEMRTDDKRKKLTTTLIIIVVALGIILAAFLVFRSGRSSDNYEQLYKQGQAYYDAGEYDKALESLRAALEVKKTDECLLLMSKCYEAKYDYVNAIAILESSTSGSETIKSEIERLKKAKEDYESGKIVVVCGQQFDVTVTSVDLSGRNAGSGAFRDLKKLTALTSLKLSNNKITTIDFLATLSNLSSLDLSNNEIEDILPLKNLTSLRTLHLDGNKITDFTPLYDLKGLSMLTIGDMDIKKSQLDELKKQLPTCIIYSDDAKDDAVDITLGGKTFKSDVTELDLSGSGVSDIALLSACTKLTKLSLANNSISDISALVDLPELKELDISNNNISDISPLMSNSKLSYLNASGNNISSLAALRSLGSLSELNLSGNPVSSLSAVGSMTSLKTLWLDGCGLSDQSLGSLYGLKNLRALSIKDNLSLSESAVSALQKKLPNCTVHHSELTRGVTLGGKSFDANSATVEANGLGISDISAVSGFTSVKNLDLSNNAISDISALRNLTTLESLDISNNRISDVSALSSLTNLKQLWLGGNDLSDDEIAALQAELPNCYITQ